MTDHLDQYAYTGGDIYRHALPQRSDRIDLTRLDGREIDFAYEWLEQLLSRFELDVVVKAPFLINQQLKHLYFDARNYERTRGNRIVGFGYPLILVTVGEEQLAAPLFVWELQLEPSPNVAESWRFTHTAQHRIRLNSYLLRQLQEDGNFTGEAELRKALRDNRLTASELVDCCNLVAGDLQFAQTFNHPQIIDAPDPEEAGELAGEGAVYWAGVVGLFPPLLAVAGEDPFPAVEAWTGQDHPFSVTALDPEQASAWQHIQQQSQLLVEGPSGTGKSHFLLHLMVNALANGRKTLIVSNSLSALRDLQDRLASFGINPFNFLLRDENHDKGLLLEILKAGAEGGGMPLNFDQSHYRILLDRCKRLWSRLAGNYWAVRRPVFGPHGWTETVGWFLRTNRSEGKELLSSQLNTSDFSFDFEEYENLLAAIEQSYPLYREVRTLRHPLTRLHGRIFTDMGKEEGLAFIEKELDFFLAKATRLQHLYINKTNGYADKLTAYYEHHFRELNRRLEALKEQLAEGANRFGERFEESGAGTLRLIGVFSGQAKEVLAAREQVARSYEELRDRLALSPFFDFVLDGDGSDPRRVRAKAAHFEKALFDWRNQISETVQEEVQRLSRKTVNPRLAYEEAVTGLEDGLELLVRELNEDSLFAVGFENKMLTIPKRQKYLEEIMEALETTRLYLRDYGPFYDWQRHWLSLPENARKAVRALIKVKPADWSTAFESWYLNNVLTQAYVPELPSGDQGIREFVKTYKQLTPLLVSRVLTFWQDRRTQSFEALRKRDREAYQLLISRKEQEHALSLPLTKLFALGLPAITDALPVLLVTPELAAELFSGLSEPVFDYILFDEAQDLPYAQAAPFLSAGRRLVISGNFRHLLPGRPLSLLEKVREEGAPVQHQTIVHRRSPGDLRRPQPAGSPPETESLHYEAVNGLFDEASQTNEAEAQQVLHVLNQIRKTPQRTYPTVGIVSFTSAQRDLIADYLLQIKRRNAPGADLIRQLERNGMGVFHLDELTGQHFQVLIISGTYGPVSVRGQLTGQLEVLEGPEGVSRLNLLMSRALEKVFVLNSMRSEDLEKMSREPEKGGTFLLAAYFRYLEAARAGQADQQKQLADAVRAWLGAEAPRPATPGFLSEVARALQPYLQSPRQEENVQVAGQILPLVLYLEEAAAVGVALRGDGFFATTAITDFQWEYQQAERLRAHGVEHLPVWSAAWWRDARQEARRLASQLIKKEEENRTTPAGDDQLP